MIKKKYNSFIFLGGQDILRGVFDSHNISFLEKLYENNIINYENVVFSYICKNKLSNKEKKILEFKLNLVKNIAKKFKFNIYFYQIKDRSFGEIKKCKNEIQKIIEKNNLIPVIFAHNYFNGFIAKKIKDSNNNSYFHLNIKGVSPEEELYYNDSFFIKRFFVYLIAKLFEKISIFSADSISVVSENFKEYIKNIHNYQKKIIVYPSVYNNNLFFSDKNLRNEYRAKYKLKRKDLVIFYSGSLQKWQEPNLIFEFFKKIEKMNNKNIKLFIFTKDSKKAIYLKNKFALKNINIINSDFKEMNSFLNMCDIGIIFRKNDLVNRVSSPTKVAEYIATKNSLIMTNSIGDYSNIFKNDDFALIFKDFQSVFNITEKDIYGLKKPSSSFLKKFKSDYSDKKISVYKEIFK